MVLKPYKSQGRRAAALQLIPLSQETRATLPTAEAAAHLCRSPQTLRAWSANDCGPLRAIRLNGRLAWAVADLKRLLGVV